MSVLRRYRGFAFFVLCGVVIGVRPCTAVEATKWMEDPAHFADTLSAIQKIVDKIPAESQPSDSHDDVGTQKRQKANKWLGENLVGKPVEFPVKVTHASIDPTVGQPGGKAPLIQIAYETALVDGDVVIDAGKIHSGGADWELLIEFPQPRPRGEANDELAEKLHQLYGQTVKLTGTVGSKDSVPHADVLANPIFSTDKVIIARAHQTIANRSLRFRLTNVSLGGLELK